MPDLAAAVPQQSAIEPPFNRLAAEELEALEGLYARTARDLFGLALWHTGSREDAAEVVQDAFVELPARGGGASRSESPGPSCSPSPGDARSTGSVHAGPPPRPTTSSSRRPRRARPAASTRRRPPAACGASRKRNARPSTCGSSRSCRSPRSAGSRECRCSPPSVAAGSAFESSARGWRQGHDQSRRDRPEATPAFARPRRPPLSGSPGGSPGAHPGRASPGARLGRHGGGPSVGCGDWRARSRAGASERAFRG